MYAIGMRIVRTSAESPRGFDLSSAKDASSLVFGLKPCDPQTFILAVIVLSEVAVLVSCVPGRLRLDARARGSHALQI